MIDHLTEFIFRIQGFLCLFISWAQGIPPFISCSWITSKQNQFYVFPIRFTLIVSSFAKLGNKDEGSDCGNLTLRRLLVWLEQPLDRLKYLNIVCDAIKEKKGGVLLSTLYSYSIHGDVLKSSLLKSGLAKVKKNKTNHMNMSWKLRVRLICWIWKVRDSD